MVPIDLKELCGKAHKLCVEGLWDSSQVAGRKCGTGLDDRAASQDIMHFALCDPLMA